MARTAENRRFMFALLYGFLGFVMMYIMTTGGMGVSVDSERYLTAAGHLKEMEGKQALRAVFPHFPMFYPLIVAMVQFLGSAEGVGATRSISILCFSISLVVVFFLGLKIQGKPTAHLSTISCLILAPLVYTFSYCWSETVYITLSLVFLLMLVLFLNAPQKKATRYLLGSAVFAGLGFSTRYIGFSLIVTGLLIILFPSRRILMSKRIKQTLLFGLVSVLPMLINLLLNLLHLGTLARESVPARFSLLHQLVRFFLTIYHDFLSFHLTFERYQFLFPGINPGGTFNSPFFWFGAIVLLCFLVFLVFFIRLILSSESFRRLFRPQKGLAAYVAFYGLLLIGITSSMQLDPMGTRFTTPLYPFILLLVFANVSHVCRAVNGRRVRRLFLGPAILGTCFFWGIQLLSTTSIYRGISSGTYPAMEQPGHRNRPSLLFLKNNLSSNDLVITNIPHKLSFIWPRDTRPWDISKLDQVLSQMAGKSFDSSVNILLCTQDRAVDPLMVTIDKDGSTLSYPLHHATVIQQCGIIEGELTERGLSYGKTAFGYDYLYRLVLASKAQKP